MLQNEYSAKSFINNNNSAQVISMIKEYGVIEKLFASYGFINSYDGNNRVFFHYSQFIGEPTSLQNGDAVEYMPSTDRRNGRPIAVSVNKLQVTAYQAEIVGNKIVEGVVVVEPKEEIIEGVVSNDKVGRIAYEQNGETFFLTFTYADIQDSSIPKCGDKVDFNIATDDNNCNICARRIVVKNVRTYQGVICSKTVNGGYIERADVVKEIFFSLDDLAGEEREAQLGQDVQFNIQLRNGKEVAMNVIYIEKGSVQFEDVDGEKLMGQVTKTFEPPVDNLPCFLDEPQFGRITYKDSQGSNVEILFGERDIFGEFTLKLRDLVYFNIATDRRDKLQRATNITLDEQTFSVNKERRLRGFIVSLKEFSGFILGADTHVKHLFNFCELLDEDKEIKLQDEVEFTLIEDNLKKDCRLAIRIKVLPRGTITNICHPGKLRGTIEKQAFSNEDVSELGIVSYKVGGIVQLIPYCNSAVTANSSHPNLHDLVEFQICECCQNKTRSAANIVVKMPTSANIELGTVASISPDLIVIELANHETEVYYQRRSSNNELGKLDLLIGDRVEFTILNKNGQSFANNLKKVLIPLNRPPGLVLPVFIQGRIIRQTRVSTPDQFEYCGLIQLMERWSCPNSTIDSSCIIYSYGISSLIDKNDWPKIGDLVRFQPMKFLGQPKAFNVALLKNCFNARIESIKAQTATLSYDAGGGHRLSFVMNDIMESDLLQVGLEIEFVRKRDADGYSAVGLRVIETNTNSVEKTVPRLREEYNLGTRVTIVRTPKCPDVTGGFQLKRGCNVTN